MTAIVADLLKTAKDIASAEQHAPILFIFTKDTAVIVSLSAAFVSKTAKQTFFHTLPVLLQRLEADWYMLVSEVWATSSTRPLKENIAVADLPLDDRCEELAAVVVYQGQPEKAKLFYARINDTPQGRLVGEWEESSGIESHLVVKW